MNTKNFIGIGILTGLSLLAIDSARAVDATTATIQALRMSGMITGGAIPATSTEFTTMVANIQAGNYVAAAQVAVNSSYFPNYLPRRMARQMMNVNLSEIGVNDTEASTFILANLIGSGTTASISKLWSQNATYLVNVNVGGVVTPTHITDLTPAQLAAVNWRTDLVNAGPQKAMVDSGTKDANNVEIYTSTPLPPQHVGGYMTLSYNKGNVLDDGSRNGIDNSFAQNGLKDGTNLRAIEGMYESSMGLSLTQMVGSVGASATVTPKFIPQLNPSFSVGQGQPACISCHGAGAANLTHGYAAFADVFDFNQSLGLVYIPTPTTNTKKSLGSNDGLRQVVLTCNLSSNPAPDCNASGTAASPTQAWDLTSWQQSGLLSQWGWSGPITGSGLNALGASLGQAGLVYSFLVQRVINEICPLGTFNPTQIASIATQAQAQDSFGYIVSQVASDLSCL